MLRILETQKEEKAAEAVGLHQTGGEPEWDSESQTDPQNNVLAQPSYPQPSTWTGLVDLKKEGINSIVSNESSEISEEHVVIHLRPEDASVGWDEDQDESMREPQEALAPKIMSLLGLTNQEKAENQGGSAKEDKTDDREEEAELAFGLDHLTVASPTPQSHTSESVLSNIMNTILRPWRYWSGTTEADISPTAPSLTSGPTPEIQRPKPKLDESKMGVRKGNPSNSNAIMEPSHKTSMAFSQTGTDDGLSELEKELIPEVQHVATTTPQGADNPSEDQMNPATLQTTSSGRYSYMWSIFSVCYVYFFLWTVHAS